MIETTKSVAAFRPIDRMLTDELHQVAFEPSISYLTAHTTAINGDKFALQKWININPNDIDAFDQKGRTPLIYAVLGDRPDCVEILLKAGAPVNSTDNEKRTALHWASYKGYVQCAKYLLNKGADWKLKDNNGMTPLHLAARNRSQRCLHLLLRQLAPGEIDDQDNFKRTALHWSALFGNAYHIRLLVKQDANIGIPDIEGKTPLHWAASCKLPSAAQSVKILLDHAPSVINWQDYEGRTALHLAVADGTKEVVEILTSAVNCNMNPMDNMFRTPLHWAALLDLTTIAKLLLERKADPTSSDSNGATPLHYAAQNNAANTVDMFLSNANVYDETDLKGRRALLWAAGKGADDVIRVMHKHNVDLTMSDKNSVTALHAAALSGKGSTCSLLVELGASLEALDFMHHTPLFYACEMGHAAVVQRLLDLKANMFSSDVDGKSLLHWAAIGGHTYVCQVLLNRDVNPNSQDLCGRTALHCAAYVGFTDCISTLIENGAKHSIQDNEGMTALHWACSKGHLSAVQTLLNNNALPNHLAFTEERYTPLDLALLGGHHEVAQHMMENEGITINRIQDIAATRIQAFYKGYCVRKNFNEKRMLLVRHEQLKRKRAENDAIRSNSVQSRVSTDPLHSNKEMNRNSALANPEEMNKKTKDQEDANKLNKANGSQEICQDLSSKRHHSADSYSLISSMREFSPMSQRESFSDDSDDDENIFKHLESRGIKLNRKRFPGRPHSSGELPVSDDSPEMLKEFPYHTNNLLSLNRKNNNQHQHRSMYDENIITDDTDSQSDDSSEDSMKKSELLNEKNKEDVNSVKCDSTLCEPQKLSVDVVKSTCLHVVVDNNIPAIEQVENGIQEVEIQKPRLGILKSLRKKLSRHKDHADTKDTENELQSLSSVTHVLPVNEQVLVHRLKTNIGIRGDTFISQHDVLQIHNGICNTAAKIIQRAWHIYKNKQANSSASTGRHSFQVEARLAAEDIWSQVLSTISIQDCNYSERQLVQVEDDVKPMENRAQNTFSSLRKPSYFSYNMQSISRMDKS